MSTSLVTKVAVDNTQENMQLNPWDTATNTWDTYVSPVTNYLTKNPNISTITNLGLAAVAITSLGLSIYAVVKINEDNKKESN